MFKLAIIVIMLLVIAPGAKALTEARLLNQSTSGQTVVFNLGSFDGVSQGDYAVVLKQIRDPEMRDLRLIPVAKARNIKLYSDSSVWILYQVYDYDLLIKGDKYNVLSESYMLKGRTSPRLGRITIVNQKNVAKSQTKQFLNDDKDRLSKLQHNYETGAVVHEQNSRSGLDADLIDIDIWEKNKDSRYRSSLYKSEHKQEWQKKQRIETFEKLVVEYVKRVNDPDFNYDDFYQKQKKADFANELNANGSVDSEYNRFLRRESQKSIADAKLYRSILERGESWSENYSDEELRLLLDQVSILQEKERREWVQVKPTRFAAAFDYGLFLSNAQTTKDSTHLRESRYSTELDLEAIPLLGHKTLERITLNASIRSSHTAFEASTKNAEFEEVSGTLGANWYPFYAPYTNGVPNVLVGSYVRSGYGNAFVPFNSEKANYTVLSFPGLRVGMKYLLKNNFGIRFLVNLETLKLERYQVSKFGSILPVTTNLVEAKFSFGLVYAF